MYPQSLKELSVNGSIRITTKSTNTLTSIINTLMFIEKRDTVQLLIILSWIMIIITTDI
jgi:hypothetical protein